MLFYTWAGPSLAQDTKAPPPKPAVPAAQSDPSMDMMQKRMDMMHLMMQSVLDQQDMMNRPQRNQAHHNP